MSRHELTPKNPNHSVVVGWDHPLQTFFIIVKDKIKEVHYEEQGFLLWKGTTPREIYEVEDVTRLAGRYAEVTPELDARLYGDKDEGL